MHIKFGCVLYSRIYGNFEMSASFTSVTINVQVFHCLFFLSYSILCFRYELLTPNVIPKGFMDGKKACEKMVGVMCVQDRFV